MTPEKGGVALFDEAQPEQGYGSFFGIARACTAANILVARHPGLMVKTLAFLR
jgi:hypothetical protein